SRHVHPALRHREQRRDVAEPGSSYSASHVHCTSSSDYTGAAMGDTTIPDNALSSFVDPLDRANTRAAEQFPGDSPHRQPVHTVYGGAHLFKADAAQKLGASALRALREHAPD